MMHNSLSLSEWQIVFERFHKIRTVEIEPHDEVIIVNLSVPSNENPEKDIVVTRRVTLESLNQSFRSSKYDYAPDIVRNLLIEWRPFIYMKETLVAFFDIIAYSPFIEQGQLNECIIKIKKLFHNVENNWGTGKRAAGIHIPYWILSDSIILALDTQIHPISRVPLRFFFAACSVIMGGAMQNGLPLRGAIGGGNFYLYEQENDHVLVSTALTNAAKVEKKQEWLGAVITPEAFKLINTHDKEFTADDAIVPFLKNGRIPWKEDAVKRASASNKGLPEKLFYIKPLMSDSNWENYLPAYFKKDKKIENSRILYQ